MKLCSEHLSMRGLGIAAALLLWISSEGKTKADDYIFSATGSWATPGSWTPSGTPGAADNIGYLGTVARTLSLSGTTRTVNNLTKVGTGTWIINGNGATASVLNVNSISTGTANLQFRDGNAVGLEVNAGDISITSGGQLYFGVTSSSVGTLLRGATVSGTTTVSGNGLLRINVVNTTGNSFSLGLLDVSGTAEVTLANAPSGRAPTTGTVTGLSGTGGIIRANLAISQIGNIATLAIVNANDYASATTLLDGAATTHGGTLLLTKAGAGTQTLSGVNTYTGATTITNGTLKLGNAAALGGRAGIVPTNTDNGTHVSAGGTLDLGGQTGVIEVIRLNGTGFGGNGALVNSGIAASIGNGVASITQTSTGTTAPTLILSGGGGTGATATATMGATTATFTVNGGTTVYSVAPTVSITGGGASINATATANLTGGVVTSITVTNPGAGYTSAPTIAFSGGTVTTAGTNPTGTGNATNFVSRGYSITATGSGYTSAPIVSFSNGTFAATTALSGIVLEGDSSIGGSGDITVDGVVSESGGSHTLTKVGTNILTLTNTGNSYTGGTIIDGGAVSIAADSALGTAPGAPTPAHLTLNGGTLATTASLTLDANRGVSLGASGGTLDIADATTLSYGGIMADSGSLTKAGTGTLALSGPSSYTGATNVNAGTLAISNNTALGTVAGGVTVANLATLQLSGDITVGDEALSLTGDGAVALVGALQNLSGNNTWGGDIDITGGGTRINSDADKLLITGDVVMTGTTGNFNVGGAGDMEISGVISGGLQIFKSSVGGGTITFSNPNNTYTNHTTVAAGTLKISTEGNLGVTPASFSSVKLRIRSGGTLQTTADMSISTNRGITISNGGGAFSPDAGTTLTVNSRITGTATDTMVKNGAGTLVLANASFSSGSSTFAGQVQVNAGTLMVTNTTGSGTGSGAVSVITGTLAGHHSGVGNIAGSVIIGTGSVLSPGSDTTSATHGTGTLKFTAVDLQSGSTGALNIDGAASFDRILVSASNGLTLNGRLVVATSLTGLALDTAFAHGTSFDLLDWAGVLGGTFAVGDNFRDGSGDNASQFDLPDLTALGRLWDISSFLTNGTITVVPEPGRALLLCLGLAALLTRRHR